MGLLFYNFCTRPHDSGGVLWYHTGCPCVCPSVVHPSVHPYSRFRTITSKYQCIFTINFVCALILWRSSLGLLMGKFREFLTELSARDTSLFSLPDDNFIKYQLIFT